MSLNRGSIRRYSRHLLIPEFGLEGQGRLQAARVLCIGAGGLGSPVLSYLAAAGVGRIGIVDDDIVDETNLQRQILFREADIGVRKVQLAATRVAEMNCDVAVDPIPVRFDKTNAQELVRLYDVIVDCTDSFGTRYHINDACVLEKKPLVYGSIFRFDGQVTVFAAKNGPCLRCLFPEPPPPGSVPTCSEGGVLGTIAGMVGTWQANEVLKLILGIGRPLVGRLALLRALDASVREAILEKDPDCAICGADPTINEVRDVHSIELAPKSDIELGGHDVDEFLEQTPGALLLDIRESHEAVLGTRSGAVSIPASELERRLHELDSSKTYVVACRMGQKSLWAIRLLRDAGFARLYHLKGGLLSYAAAATAVFDLF